MKSIQFKVDYRNIQNEENNDPTTKEQYPFVVKMELPLLPAYSVEYLTVNVNGLSSMSSIAERINNDELISLSQYVITEDFDDIYVVIYYHGIRDYSLLFPQVSSESLKERLGHFYEEAERNFEQGAWLSFSLMCGAVFEGMLYSRLLPSSRNTFSDMIIVAHEQNIISDKQRVVMDVVRKARNLVHANKVEHPYVSRKNAMDIRTTLDKLIKDFSY